MGSDPWEKQRRLMTGGDIGTRSTRWQRREAGEGEMAAEMEGGGRRGELPAADGSQSQ